MNRRLRRRHRRIIGLLAVVLPLAFVVALAVRPQPIVEPLPRPMLPPPVAEECVLLVSDDLWEALPVRTRLLGEPGSSEVRVELEAIEPLRLPDLLAYWVPVRATRALPGNAKFLGEFRGDLRLPAEARAVGGALVLYSLAHGEIADTANLPLIAEDAPCR